MGVCKNRGINANEIRSYAKLRVAVDKVVDKSVKNEIISLESENLRSYGKDTISIANNFEVLLVHCTHCMALFQGYKSIFKKDIKLGKCLWSGLASYQIRILAHLSAAEKNDKLDDSIIVKSLAALSCSNSSEVKFLLDDINSCPHCKKIYESFYLRFVKEQVK